jgi:hypothetical protein
MVLDPLGSWVPFANASVIAPSIEVVGRVDCTADSTGLLLSRVSHREILCEGSRSFNGWLVYTLSSVEAVVVAVGGKVAAQSPGLTGSEHIPGLDDIVFDERVASPSIQREVARTLGVVLSVVCYSPT